MQKRNKTPRSLCSVAPDTAVLQPCSPLPAALPCLGQEQGGQEEERTSLNHRAGLRHSSNIISQKNTCILGVNEAHEVPG